MDRANWKSSQREGTSLEGDQGRLGKVGFEQRLKKSQESQEVNMRRENILGMEGTAIEKAWSSEMAYQFKQ